MTTSDTLYHTCLTSLYCLLVLPPCITHHTTHLRCAHIMLDNSYRFASEAPHVSLKRTMLGDVSHVIVSHWLSVCVWGGGGPDTVGWISNVLGAVWGEQLAVRVPQVQV